MNLTFTKFVQEPGSGTGTNEELGGSISVTACPGMDLVQVTSDIDENTTWKTNTVYIIRANDFYVNATLVIEPGAIIKFHPEGTFLTLGGTGTIVANGTSDNPIVFTSFFDDSQGCDNNGDGTATTPARRDWGMIDTNGLNGSVFNYCEFYYGGNSAYSATLTLSAGSKARITNSTFAHNDGSDASGWYGALDASSAIAETIITDNVFFDNIRPLSISIEYNIDDSNLFSNPDDATQTNTYNGIFIGSSDEISGNISWLETEIPFVIDDNDLRINSGGSLTLGDDVVLKFRPESVLLLVDGISQLINNDGAGVYFTSYKDDTLKGDTNADGSATSPADGDWGGIYDDTAPLGGPYYFSWANILHDDIH